MASPTVFDCFAKDCLAGIHNFNTDDIYLYLTNNTPNKATNKFLTDLPGLATGGGYTAGGVLIGPMTLSQVNGLASVAPGSDALFTATSGFGPFRYAVTYNHTAAAKNLINFWDNGVSISTPAGLFFLVDLATVMFTNGYS